MKVLIILITGLGLAVSGCARVSEANNTLEPVYAAVVVGSELRATVQSTGCTKAEDFSVTAIRKVDKTLLSLNRVAPDRCRRMPFALDIRVDISDLKIDPALPVVIENPKRVNRLTQ